MSGAELTLLATGDLILPDAESDWLFDEVRDVLRTGDVVIGHIESFNTLRGHHATAEPGTGYSPRDPRILEAIPRAGFHVGSMAHNHSYDGGPAAIEDTRAVLETQGMVTTGAGMTLEEARTPAILERDGVRFGFLSYNTVGPRASWAMSTKAGAAYVHVLTHYENEVAGPGLPPTSTYTFVAADSLSSMQDDIEQLRGHVDIVTVSMHIGLVHVPDGKLADYERPLTRAAIDAGADVVVGHHAHALRGVEVYKGRPIYHGLGNFVTVSKPVANNPDAVKWSQMRYRLGLTPFEPDPEYPTYRFLPEAKNTMIARITVNKDGVQSAGFIPCWVNSKAQPVPLGHTIKGAEVAAYVESLNSRSGLKADFSWSGDHVLFLGAGQSTGTRAANGAVSDARV
jgi:poly-gamma-glutamate capsule biosynthesis protein CapA/YwtB (metallophosphatase superfamily)